MVAPDVKKVLARFYATPAGNEPVRDWILKLEAQDRRIIGYDIATAEFGWPVGMPVCKSLKGGLWEIRSSLTGNRISRVFVCVHQGELFLLHGFIKKSQQTPKSDMDLAIARKREVENDK